MITITGATGDFGGAVVDQLVADGTWPEGARMAERAGALHLIYTSFTDAHIPAR
jgi:nucleoside-diphosphate-sugar epimerase